LWESGREGGVKQTLANCLYEVAWSPEY